MLHLLPGALITAFYVLATPVVVRSFGFPSLMAIFLAILFVIISFELRYLFYRARKSGSSLGSAGRTLRRASYDGIMKAAKRHLTVGWETRSDVGVPSFEELTF